MCQTTTMKHLIDVAWSRLSREEQAKILVAQAEWIVFFIKMFGMDIDQRSLNAVAEARRASAGCTESFAVYEAKRDAQDAFMAVGGPLFFDLDKYKLLNNYVASICWSVLTDICPDKHINYKTTKISRGILGRAYYNLDRIGDKFEHSPLAKWVANTIAE